MTLALCRRPHTVVKNDPARLALSSPGPARQRCREIDAKHARGELQRRCGEPRWRPDPPTQRLQVFRSGGRLRDRGFPGFRVRKVSEPPGSVGGTRDEADVEQRVQRPQGEVIKSDLKPVERCITEVLAHPFPKVNEMFSCLGPELRLARGSHERREVLAVRSWAALIRKSTSARPLVGPSVMPRPGLRRDEMRQRKHPGGGPGPFQGAGRSVSRALRTGRVRRRPAQPQGVPECLAERLGTRSGRTAEPRRMAGPAVPVVSTER